HWVEAGGLARASDVRRTLASPQVGLRVALPGRVDLRANGSSARRAPDFLELFGNQGSVLGNPTLRPERARNADLGLAWSGPPGRRLTLAIELAHFETRAEDLVVYIRHSQSSVRAENIARARVSGEELSARLEAPGGIALTGGMTRMATRDQGPVPHWNGRRLPLRPGFLGFARLDLRRGGFRAVSDLHYIGEDFLDRANLRRVPDRLLVGASLSFGPQAGGLRFTVEGKNLGDDRLSDVGGFPLPGRAVFASCELRLGPTPSTRPPGEP
ncbi:MAG: TonB-dependent receptor domain-containing protein, partial [Candidatus Eiseniibacteriota bacterium]